LVIEVGVQVPGPFDSPGPVVCSATPGGTAARAVHVGPYDRLGEAHDAIREWCKQNNHPIAGPFWEVYGHWNDNPNQLRTDVYYLLKSA
jgi:effector-binding domain-containing protein